MTLRPNTHLTYTIRTALEQKYLEQFLIEAIKFYDNPDILKEITFKCKISGRMTSALASLEHIGNIGHADDRTLLAVPQILILRIARTTLNLPDADIEKIIRHEVIHIGHMNHGKTFKRLCVAFNASYKGWNLSTVTKDPFEVQIQKGYGTRFKTLKKFNNMKEADTYIELCAKTMNGTQLRIRHRRKATIDDLGGY